jgi:hypothetical protein
MNPIPHLRREVLRNLTRRHFLRDCTTGLGAAWLASQGEAIASMGGGPDSSSPRAPIAPHFPAKAKNVIFLHMEGAPSQLELFEHKPELAKLDGKDCPKEYLEGKRFAFIRGVPKLLGPVYPFHQEAKTGIWISNRLPHFERVIEKVSFIRTMQTDQFNHAPAQLLLYTGNQNFGYASLGSWVTYGLGTESENLPGFVVLISGGRFPSAGKAAWGTGFLPSVFQGVQCRSDGDPVLYLSNPPGIDAETRRKIVATIESINRRTYDEIGDAETVTRITQYETAHRMQLSAGDAMDIRLEPAEVHALYGTQPGKESFANNCLLARRLVERGVRFVQLFDWGWDSHGSSSSEALNMGFKTKCQEMDQAMAALLIDLDRCGLLDETLVVWAAEFGRTPMRENRGGMEMKFIGRDHHPFAYTIWLAGAGIRQGHSVGETDAIGYNPVTEPVQVRDLQATMLHVLGIDHTLLTYPFQGLDQRLTGVTKPSRLIKEVLA